MIYSKLSFLCIVCIIILLFGLWPFNFHSENQVHWLQNQDGIEFHKQRILKSYNRGIAYSTKQVDTPQSSGYSPVTIEINLEPKKEPPNGLGYILSFYDDMPQEPLIIAQWLSHLVIRSRVNETDKRNKYREIGVRDALQQNRKTLITVASGEETTDIFVNGKLAQAFSRTSFISLSNIKGQLVIGNSSIGADPWIGNLYGLSIYDRLLSTEQIRQNYKNWNKPGNSKPELQNHPFIMYTFKKQNDSHILNLVDDNNHLVIPSTFTPLERKLLVPFWDDFKLSRGLVSDVIINVFGFIPFGFVMAIYLIKQKHLHRGLVYMVTILSGACLSLIIEITQIYLPTRHSSSLDLVCNTVGAILGIVVLIVGTHFFAEKKYMQAQQVSRE